MKDRYMEIVMIGGEIRPFRGREQLDWRWTNMTRRSKHFPVEW